MALLIREANATRWTRASTPGAQASRFPTPWAGGSLRDVREVHKASPEDLWAAVECIGGRNGWYSSAFCGRHAGRRPSRRWRRPRRGRRDPKKLMVGEAVDFWRVEERLPPRLLRLRAEMKMPGRAWLEFSVHPDGAGGSVLIQRAVYWPRGIAGHAYWWSVAPFHAFVFPRWPDTSWSAPSQ